MAIQGVASWNGAAAGATLAIAVSGIQTGDLLVVVTCCYSDLVNPTVLTPTDNQSNSWTQRVASTWGGTTFFSTVTAIADCVVAATGPTTITVRSSAAADIAGMVLRVSGQVGSGYADKFAASTDGPIMTVTPMIAATTSVGGTRLVVHAMGSNAPAGGVPRIAPSGCVLFEARSFSFGFAIAAKTALAGVESGLTWRTASPGGEWSRVAGTYVEGGLASDAPYPPLGRGASW